MAPGCGRAFSIAATPVPMSGRIPQSLKSERAVHGAPRLGLAGPSQEAAASRKPPRTRRSHAGKTEIRSRVEHVFADQKPRMGFLVRAVGIKRAEMKIGRANLVYNIARFLYLERPNAT